MTLYFAETSQKNIPILNFFYEFIFEFSNFNFSFRYRIITSTSIHIRKENDNESQLGDFGVRKYDEDIGRFTSIDPLFEKYNGWNPYQYCRNNPINAFDDNGKFEQKDHTNAMVAAGVNQALAGANYIVNDLLSYKNQNIHLDNKENYEQIETVITNVGGFDKLDDHTIGDFYAHSNYVEIWNQLKEEGAVTGVAPIFEDAKSVPVFQNALENQLRTTNYPSKGNNDPYSHNNGESAIDPTLQKSKDEKSEIQKFQSKDTQSKKHDQALKLYIRSLKRKHETE